MAGHIHCSVADIEKNMDAEEFLEWEAFDKYIEPIGGRKLDHVSGGISKMVYAMGTTESNTLNKYKTKISLSVIPI